MILYYITYHNIIYMYTYTDMAPPRYFFRAICIHACVHTYLPTCLHPSIHPLISSEGILANAKHAN